MPAVFFTMAGNIIWPYVMPGLPALALLIGGWLTTRANQPLVRLNLALGLSITMVLAIGFNISMPFTGRSDDLAAKTLIQAYEAHREASEPLIYLGHRPFSAAFYSRGQAQIQKTPAELEKRLQGQVAYVAIRTSDLAYMPATLMTGLEPLGVHGYFTLFRKLSAAAATPTSPTSK